MSQLPAPVRPEPVKLAGAIGGALAGVGTIVVALGWVSQANMDATTGAVVGLVSSVMVLLSIAAPIVTALRARRQVTPLADPRAADGVPLVPEYPPPPAPEFPAG